MAFPDVTTEQDHPVEPIGKGAQEERRINHSQAHNPKDPDVGRVLDLGQSCLIRSGITTPVTGKAQDGRLESVGIRELQTP
jgi:hypothetical protein